MDPTITETNYAQRLATAAKRKPWTAALAALALLAVLALAAWPAVRWLFTPNAALAPNPAEMSREQQIEYVHAVAAEYAATSDAALARRRIEALGPEAGAVLAEALNGLGQYNNSPRALRLYILTGILSDEAAVGAPPRVPFYRRPLVLGGLLAALAVVAVGARFLWHAGALGRVAHYVLARGLSLLGIVAVVVYLTILITNKSIVLDNDVELLPPGTNPSPIGGFFAGIANPPVMSFAEEPGLRQLKPGSAEFFATTLRLLVNGMTLNLGPTYTRYFFSGEVYTNVRQALLLTLPRTLLVFGSVNLLVFFASIGLALVVSRRVGTWLDRFVMGLAPLSAVPPWLYGVGITVGALYGLRLYLGGLWDRWPTELNWQSVIFIARIAVPAILALFLSKFFQSVLAWRSFLLVFAGEDYMELAKAKGLPNGLLERRYLLRPVLPSIITTFAVLMIGMWQDAIVVELFFGVVGIGHLFYNAIRYNDMAMIVGLTVTFAYLLAITVFVLDIVYAIVDPRIRIGQDRTEGRLMAARPARRRADRRARRSLAESNHKVRAPWRPLAALRGQLQAVRANLARTWPVARPALRRPSVLAGLGFIGLLVGVSLYTLAAVPLAEAVRLWNDNDAEWEQNPPNAFPAWTNYFRRDRLPASLALEQDDPRVTHTVTPLSDEVTEITWVFPIEYPYGTVPQEMSLFVTPTYTAKLPYAAITWLTPDGREIHVGDFTFRTGQRIAFTQLEDLARSLGVTRPLNGLFGDPGAQGLRVVPGRYELRIEALTFEPGSSLDVSFGMTGSVHGWAGTDYKGRDMAVALLWGAPVALAVGLVGALATVVVTLLVSATGAWFGGWLDGAIQRLTEVNMLLPAFPILLIVFNFYTESLWVLLGVAIALTAFGAAIKTYRAVFLQVKEQPYVEAARAYGAGPVRLILQYLVPPVVPLLIPQLILTVPTYVFLEATLAHLNMSDPLLPTWGKLIKDGVTNGGLTGASHTVLLPAGILVLTSLAFLVVGHTLERVLNPRLHDV